MFHQTDITDTIIDFTHNTWDDCTNTCSICLWFWVDIQHRFSIIFCLNVMLIGTRLTIIILDRYLISTYATENLSIFRANVSQRWRFFCYINHHFHFLYIAPCLLSLHSPYNVKWMGIKVTSYLYVGKILLWTHCSTLYIDDKKMKHQRHQVIVNRWFVMGAIHEMMMFNILFWFR